jgi:hypothetical protein
MPVAVTTPCDLLVAHDVQYIVPLWRSSAYIGLFPLSVTASGSYKQGLMDSKKWLKWRGKEPAETEDTQQSLEDAKGRTMEGTQARRRTENASETMKMKTGHVSSKIKDRDRAVQ